MSAPFRPTMFDRAIMAIAPEMGDRRLAARQRSQLRMQYDAGRASPRTSSWPAQGVSADAAAGMGQREYLRYLARDFVRNRPFAARGVSVITSNVVGVGVKRSVRLRSGSEAVQLAVSDLYDRHLGTTDIDAQGLLDFAAMQRVGFASVVQDGEVLLRRRWRAGRYGRGLALPFQIEVIEADFLNTAIQAWGENEVIDGVEYGPTGAAVAYHIYRAHPMGASRVFDMQSDRVPASEIIHVYRADRPGQARGVSWFAPVMMTLGDLSDYQEGEIIKQKIAALMAGFIETDPVDESIGQTDGAAGRAADMGLEELAPGTITRLSAGERVSFTTPPLVNSYDQFTRAHLAAVAMGLGITYEALSGDLSRVNFSSARMGRIEMDSNVAAWQTQVLINQMCRGVERWMREAITLARPVDVVGADYRVDYTPPRRPLIDPTREVAAIERKIESGISSRQREQRALGLDPDVIEEERAQDAARDGKLAKIAGNSGAAA